MQPLMDTLEIKASSLNYISFFDLCLQPCAAASPSSNISAAASFAQHKRINGVIQTQTTMLLHARLVTGYYMALISLGYMFVRCMRRRPNRSVEI